MDKDDIDKFENTLSMLGDAKSILDDIIKDFKNASETLGEYLDILGDPLELFLISKEDLREYELKFKVYMMLASNKIDAINVLLND